MSTTMLVGSAGGTGNDVPGGGSPDLRGFRSIRLPLAATLPWFVIVAMVGPVRAQEPLGTTFTYQGRLTQNGTPFEGTVNLAFKLYDAEAQGSQVGGDVVLLNRTVENGLLTAKVNEAAEFGPNAFDGESRWLEIWINGAPLSPRQQLTASPNAMFAAKAQPPVPLALTSAEPGSFVIRGQNTAGDGTGVRGEGNPGIRGYATGGGTGVYGSAERGTGILGYCFGSETGTGVTAYVQGTNNGTTAVAGIATGSTGDTYGGVFQVSSPNGVGVFSNMQSGGWAGRFMGGGQSGNGVYVSAPNVGLQVASGTKSAVVRTADGARALYCEEATEVWFTDYGTARLNDGRATVSIEPIFAQVVNLTQPYHVLVQLEGDCQGVYVTGRTETTFDVVELRGGHSGAPFSYRIVAKRRGYEAHRLERAPHADDDPNLFPEKRAQWEARFKSLLDAQSVSDLDSGALSGMPIDSGGVR